MVKTINVSFNDDVFSSLLARKFNLAKQLKTSLSWEEFIMHLANKLKGNKK